MELEGSVVMAEVEQVREPSSEGQGFTAGSAEASVWSGLPLCGDPCFGFRFPEPAAEKDTEKWGCETLAKAGLQHGGLEAGSARHTGHRDKSWAAV